MTKNPIMMHIALPVHNPAGEVGKSEHGGGGEFPVSGGGKIISEGREDAPHQLMTTRRVKAGGHHIAENLKAWVHRVRGWIRVMGEGARPHRVRRAPRAAPGFPIANFPQPLVEKFSLSVRLRERPTHFSLRTDMGHFIDKAISSRYGVDRSKVKSVTGDGVIFNDVVRSFGQRHKKKKKKKKISKGKNILTRKQQRL